MTATITHRGPDDNGYLFDGTLGLGFRRLSIIDLAGGHQPMADARRQSGSSSTASLQLPRAARRAREPRPPFRTNSDTEAIVLGYKEWGTGVFGRLNGMFGVAIWDTRNRRLVLARDAMGIKLVYYAIRGGSLWFGSEMASITGAMEERPEIDPVALNLFLRYRYTAFPAPTIFKGVEKLAARNNRSSCRRTRRERAVTTMTTSTDAAQLLDALERS